MIVYIILGIAAVVMAAVGYLLGSKSQTEQIKTLTSERDVQKAYADNYKASLETETERNRQKEAELKELRTFFKNDLEKLVLYIRSQNTNPYSYRDYLRACNYLGLDMSESKNRYPHNFKRWHDIRIDEYNTAKALKDEQERKEFYEKFTAVASKYLGLEYDKKSVYIAIIAQKPSDLIHEGELLHPCVGRMGYDQKFAREESLIFFIRTKEEPEKPLVTVEYSLKNKKVLQCYGDHDSKPDDCVMEFVNKKWLPYANRKLKQIAA